ncbi:MAG TPA: hypothetical protein VHW23_36170 [Kofleriaceae bacterium]|nr:hypothetical protein [Kofleriaceae bacterium]
MKPIGPWLAAVAALAACAGRSELPAVRFTNAPPVLAVNDRLDVPRAPASREVYMDVYHWDGVVQRRIDRGLDLPRPRRALGVNALDEVPDSTWFTNRIGVRDLTVEELANGPLTLDSPELYKPWTIKSAKPGTGDIGFVVEDTRGVRFLIKFDMAGYPEQETATHVIVDKILWACGYNTTEDFIVHLRRDDLVVGRDAHVTDVFGDKHPIDAALVDQRLTLVEHMADGGYRALASRWIDGTSLGGHPAEGVRGDDPNDRIPHELRRDLRGANAFFAWLDHVDVQEPNFLDSWVTDRGNPRRHYVKHYLLDFGKSLGVMASTGHDPRRSHAYVIDFGAMTASLFELGLVERTWEPRTAPRLRGVGLFDARTYDPGAWLPDYPVYTPFLLADRFDEFWAAKILIRFTRPQLRALVETGQLSDPRAADYVTDTLVARQRATAAYWFARVNPLDRFAAYRDRLCFDDLAVAYRFAPAATTRYEVRRYDRQAHPLDVSDARGIADGRVCVPLTLPADGDGYAMVRITTTRPGFAGSTVIHVARDTASAAPRVVGIWRE